MFPASTLCSRLVLQIGLDEFWLEKLQRRTGHDRQNGRRQYRVIRVCAIGFCSLVDTLSIRGVGAGGHDRALDSILARADQALYEAKRGGRDQLRVA